jgi:hypothetical protein
MNGRRSPLAHAPDGALLSAPLMAADIRAARNADGSFGRFAPALPTACALHRLCRHSPGGERRRAAAAEPSRTGSIRR